MDMVRHPRREGLEVSRFFIWRPDRPVYYESGGYLILLPQLGALCLKRQKRRVLRLAHHEVPLRPILYAAAPGDEYDSKCLLAVYTRQVLNARVYDVAIVTPLQEAMNMSREFNNTVYLKVLFNASLTRDSPNPETGREGREPTGTRRGGEGCVCREQGLQPRVASTNRNIEA